MDQFYFEAGYLEEDYFGYVASAEIAISAAFTDSFTVIVAETTGYFITDYIEVDYFVGGGVIRDASAVLVADSEQITTVTNIKQFDSVFAVDTTVSVLAGRVIEATVSVDSAFTPTLTADGFKNHTAILETQFVMNTAAVVERSANVLLEHLANLNAMAVKTADLDSAITATTDQTTQAQKTSQAQISLTAETAQTTTALLLVLPSDTIALTSNFSIYASRYLGTGRPRSIPAGGGQDGSLDYQFIDQYISTSVKKFGTSSLGSGALNAPRTVGPSLPQYVIPKANESWVFQEWIYRSGSGSDTNLLSFVPGNFVQLRYLNDNTIRLFTNKTSAQSYTSTATVPLDAWQHLAVVYVNGTISVYLEGNRIITASISTVNNWTGYGSNRVPAITAPPRIFVDDVSFSVGTNLGFDPTQTTITVPTTVTINDPNTTRFLYHFDHVAGTQNAGLDDTSIAHSALANLAVTTVLSAQANPNTKQAVSAVDAVSALVCAATALKLMAADLVSVSSIAVVIGKQHSMSAAVDGVFDLVDGLARIRFAESTQNVLFTPTIVVQANRVGEIVLFSEFVLDANANSFTLAQGSIDSAFGLVVAADGITRLTSAALAVSTNVVAVTGFAQLATVNITSAFDAQFNVQYFQGTSLLAPMSAAMSVTVAKTATTTQALVSTATVSATAQVNPQAAAANGFFANPFPERVVVNMAYTYRYDRQAYDLSNADPNRINKAFDMIAYAAGDAAAAGAIPNNTTVPNAPMTAEARFANTSADSNEATAFIEFTVLEQDPSAGYPFYFTKKYRVTAGIVETITNLTPNFQGGITNGSGTIEIILDVNTGGFITVLANGSTTPQQISNTIITTTGPFVRNLFLNRPATPSNPPTVVFGDFRGDLYSEPSGQPSRNGNLLTISSQTVSEQNLTLFFGPQEYGQADLFSQSDFNVTVLGVLFASANVSSVTTQTAQAQRLRNVPAALIVNTALAATAQTQSSGVAVVTVNSTMSVTGVSILRPAQTNLAITSTQSTDLLRIRNFDQSMAVLFTQAAEAVKTTSVIVAADTNVSLVNEPTRIRNTGADLLALNLQLTAAFVNATGTVLLESVFTQQTIAEKNAVGVIEIAAEFTQTTDTADSKTVRVSADLAVTATVSAQGLRIQPAGADLTVLIAQVTDTTFSKIARVTADFTVTVTQITNIDRIRDGAALQASLGTLSCSIDKLRQVNADLNVNFGILVSATNIIRITAEFTALASTLTVGRVFNLDPQLTLVIHRETRLLEIDQESRVITIDRETRVNTI